MAKRDVYRFSIESNNQQAKKSFEELRDLAKEVQDSTGKLRKEPTGDGNLTRTVKTMTDMLNTYSELAKTLDEEQTINIKMKGDKDVLKRLKETRLQVEKETAKMQKDYNSAMHSYKAQTGQTPRVATPYGMNQDKFSDTKIKANAFAQDARDIKNMANRTVNIGNTAMKTGYANHAQATEYQGNTAKLLGQTYQGASIEDVRRGLRTGDKSYKVDPASVRGNALGSMEEARKGIDSREATVRKVKEDNTIKDPLQREAVISKNTEEIKDLREALNNAKRVIEALDNSVVSVSTNNAEMESGEHGTITQKADRGTMSGRMFERASSIGLAMAGTMAYSIASAYSKGSGSVKEMRPQSLDVGYATGNSDFRGIRQDLMGQGAEYGYQGKEMLDFTQSILSSAGFKDQDSLKEMTQAQMEFGKFSGAGTESANKYTEDMYKSGAISTADQAKAIQQGFLGAIKMSGMEGREKEQIDALSAINENLFKGREATEDEVKNRQAMSAILANSGNKGLQGDNLANVMTSMDDLIKNASPWSLEGMALGVGSTPGMNMYDFNLKKEQGMAGENLDSMMNVLNTLSNGDVEVGAGLLETRLQTGNQEGVKEMMELYNKGELTGDKLDEMKTALEDSGKDEETKRSEAYLESSDALKESFDAFTAKMETLLSENKLIDGLTSFGKGIAKWGSKNPIQAGLAVGGIAGGKALATGLGSALSLGGVTEILGKATPKMTPTGKIGGLSGFFKTGGAGASTLSKAKNLFGMGGKGAVEATSGAVDDVVGATVEGATKASTATSMGSNLLKGTEGMSKMATATNAGKQALSSMGSKIPYLQLALSGVQIAMADDKKRETTKQAGGLTGMMAGTVAGASLGSVIPGVGTAIGGIVGGTAGYMGGLGIGDWWHSKTEDMFGGKDKKKKKDKSKDPKVKVKGAYDEQEELATDQEEQAQENSEYSVEKLREHNISLETENLAVAFDLIARIERALETAKAQNGIVGDTSGLNSGGGGSDGGGVGGELSYTGNSEYWSNTDLTKHDLGKTSNSLTGDQLDEWINSNTSKDSIMRGMGSTFMQAGKESGLDPRYLVAHSAHETGWGTSQISKEKGNMYGIGAFDATPYSSAYGYDDTKSGIVEGAKWISKNYYKEGQNTLDSMRNNGGVHEYATDPAWATKIGATMKGSEKYTKPSNVNVTTNVTMTSSGNTKSDGEKLAKEVNKYIDYSSVLGTNYTQERKRI